MIGAILGDIIGSVYEFEGMKTKDFPLFSPDSEFTDDTIMTLAVASALLETEEERRGGDSTGWKDVLIRTMKAFGKRYPDPMGGYGGRFRFWLFTCTEPYNSFGNGSAMRVSPCGFAAESLEEALALAKASAEVTHNHPEGIKGAQAAAGCVYLAKTGHSKEEIRSFVTNGFYDLDFTLDEIRETYRFYESCQETVPQSIEAFLESSDFEDALRNTISLGGDADTMGAITGAIASAFYGVPEALKETGRSYLPEDLLKILEAFEAKYESE